MRPGMTIRVAIYCIAVRVAIGQIFARTRTAQSARVRYVYHTRMVYYNRYIPNAYIIPYTYELYYTNICIMV